MERIRLAEVHPDAQGGVMMSVAIERANNGYIVRHADENCEGEPMDIVEVCEQTETGCQCAALAYALRVAVDALDMYGSKHDACRIQVSCKCEEDG